jgi:hypothetical protein
MDFIRQFLFMLLTCHVCVAMASPTSNEFLPCHKMASAVLLHCLDEKTGHGAGDCWDRSRNTNDTCYEDVWKSHRPDPDRIKAEKKAKEEAKKAMEKDRHEKASQ